MTLKEQLEMHLGKVSEQPYRIVLNGEELDVFKELEEKAIDDVFDDIFIALDKKYKDYTLQLVNNTTGEVEREVVRTAIKDEIKVNIFYENNEFTQTFSKDETTNENIFKHIIEMYNILPDEEGLELGVGIYDNNKLLAEITLYKI